MIKKSLNLALINFIYKNFTKHLKKPKFQFNFMCFLTFLVFYKKNYFSYITL